MPDNDNTRFLRFGQTKKSTFEMSAEELKRVSAEILNRAKEKAFSRGLAIYYSRNDKVFAEYADGKILEVR
jgi:hypothetical protein